jgi:hypothetical protein
VPIPDRFDRLVAKTQGGDLRWRYQSALARAVQVSVAVALLILLVVSLAPPWRHFSYVSYIAPLLTIVGVAMNRQNRYQSVQAPEARRAALAALQASGRETRPGTWVVDGADAAELARRFGRWAVRGLSPEELVPAEPENVAIESYQPGQDWPAAPREDTQGWPRLDERGQSQVN